MQRLCAALVMFCLAGFTWGAEASRPNIVLIVGDDLGYADVSCYDVSQDVRTPNIDALAAGGVRFTNGYVSGPMCSPTRAGLLTGRYQQRFGFDFNPDGIGRENKGIDVEQVTLADVLREAGYRTALIGKWHLGYSERFQPLQRGFDEFFGFLAGAHGYMKDENTILRGNKVVPESEYLTDAFTREALAFIERNHDTPFFLYLPYNAPHAPLQAPQKYLDRFKNVQDERRRTFLAMLSAMDDGVGQVMEALKKHGLDGAKTLVIFISDNGGPTAGNTSLNTPFSGVKGTVREGGIRTASMIRWDGHVPAGKVEDTPMIQLDYFPTIAKAAGAGDAMKDLKLDGVDLMPFLTGKSGEKPHETLYWRFGQPMWAVRDANLKLFDMNDGKGIQLVDLATDLAEANNLAESRSDDVKRLKALYDSWNAKNEDPRWPLPDLKAYERQQREKRQRQIQPAE